MRCAVQCYTRRVKNKDGRNVEMAKTSKFKKTTETIRFRWDRVDKIENLIRCLANYKSQMDYQNIDFNGDKVKQYEAVREAMARIYEEPSFFGPPFITPTPDKELDEEERAAVEKQQKLDKDLIKKGYTRIQEKIKEIRQNCSTAVTSSLLSINVAFWSRNVRC